MAKKAPMPPMAKGKPAPAKKSGLSQLKEAFEDSGMDNDKGVTENSKADKARDKKQFAAFKQKQGKGKK